MKAWLASLGLIIIKPKKSKRMLFGQSCGTHRAKFVDLLNIQVDVTQLQFAETAKTLGVYI